MKIGDVVRARHSGRGDVSGVRFTAGDICWVKRREPGKVYLLHTNGDISGVWHERSIEENRNKNWELVECKREM